jgi:hypothetical protein
VEEIMLKMLVAAGALAFAGPALAQYNYGTGSNPSAHAVSGYTTSGGSYVAPHYQTNPNSSTHDNYGAAGNINPYTGAVGHGYR